ncbi:MAG: hypothetical protein LBH00_13225 [Planctomycetaceae bacterium]|jgi:hypothetical protein|nr:hypothetical protein [Planctomycetaceae bacterium]
MRTFIGIVLVFFGTLSLFPTFVPGTNNWSALSFADATMTLWRQNQSVCF